GRHVHPVRERGAHEAAVLRPPEERVARRVVDRQRRRAAVPALAGQDHAHRTRRARLRGAVRDRDAHHAHGADRLDAAVRRAEGPRADGDRGFRPRVLVRGARRVWAGLLGGAARAEPHGAHERRRRRDRGIALITAVLSIAVLTALIADFSYATLVEH